MKVQQEKFITVELKPEDIVEAILNDKRYELESIQDAYHCTEDQDGLHRRIKDSKRIITIKFKKQKDEEVKIGSNLKTILNLDGDEKHE